MTRVLNKHSDAVPTDAVWIMRPGRWGNRFVIGRDGSRAEVIEKHRRWHWDEIMTGRVTLEELAALDDKSLVCCCAPKPCHGHTLAKAAEWAKERLLSSASAMNALINR